MAVRLQAAQIFWDVQQRVYGSVGHFCFEKLSASSYQGSGLRFLRSGCSNCWLSPVLLMRLTLQSALTLVHQRKIDYISYVLGVNLTLNIIRNHT